MVMLKNREWNGQAAPKWATAVAKWHGCWFWEESIEQKPGDRFCRCGVDFEEYASTYSKLTPTGYDVAYLLPKVEAEDDPLPPVPGSVMYNAEQASRLEVATLPPNANYYEARIRIGVYSNAYVHQGRCTSLDPDAALQLAHDLRRMAMDIKRKQKEVD